MSRATINTSATLIGDSQQDSTQTAKGKRLKLAILGDFSGRESRSLCKPDTLATRRLHRLTKDTFEQVFEDLNVSIDIPVSEKPIQLEEFDDLHPDYLYSRIPLFKQFIDLEKQLLNPSELNKAATEIQSWADEPSADLANPDQPKLSTSNLLDDILSRKAATPTSVDHGKALIQSIIAPYVEPKQDPRQDTLLANLNEAVSQTMRKIIHQSSFQQIEASWRSLHRLIRELDSHPLLQIDILDVSKQELLDDLRQADDDLEQAQIFKRLVASQTAAGDTPYNLVVGDFMIEDFEQDIGLLIDMGTIAEATDGCFIAGANPRLAGCPTLAGSVDPDDWYYNLDAQFAEGWSALRDYSASAHIALAAPRYLLRLPYGCNTASTDCFDFEELDEPGRHRYYLWGNSAYLLAQTFCEDLIHNGLSDAPPQSAQIDNLPIHIYKDGIETHTKPCAEALLTDSASARFQEAGLTVVRSIKQQDSVVIPKLQSLHIDNELRGIWITAPMEHIE